MLPFKTPFNTDLTEYITVEFAVNSLSNSDIIKNQRGATLYIEDNSLKISTFSFDEGFLTSTIDTISSDDMICLIYEDYQKISIYINGVFKFNKKISPSGEIEVLSKLKYLRIFEYKLNQDDMLTVMPNRTIQSILLPQPLRKIGNIKDKFYWDEDKGHYCIEQNVSKELEVMASPNIIDLPHLNKKYSLDTYMPTTYLQCVDTTIQPSKLLLESDIVRYKPSALEANTDYTVQFECKEKSN